MKAENKIKIYITLRGRAAIESFLDWSFQQQHSFTYIMIQLLSLSHFDQLPMFEKQCYPNERTCQIILRGKSVIAAWRVLYVLFKGLFEKRRVLAKEKIHWMYFDTSDKEAGIQSDVVLPRSSRCNLKGGLGWGGGEIY